MKKFQITLSLLSICLLSGCAKTPEEETAVLPVLAPESELSVTSSKEQVEEFEKIAGFTEFSDHECFNITPDFIAESRQIHCSYPVRRECFMQEGGLWRTLRIWILRMM